ncbi:MAG: tRNA (cytidine(34)-2'-O)-methyltransferase [Beijerinckiaceae bacterium]|nr:tRNA (cytidine(34)-2'-O)-methyltransferase [Beijerinckiaceae bacterium]
MSGHPPLTLALYQPDIPQNCGTMLRMCACLGIASAIIEPASFPVSDRHFRRAGMDYLDALTIQRHISFAQFEAWRTQQTNRDGSSARLVLLSTKAAVPYTGFTFRHGDILLVGRESAGVPEAVHAATSHRVVIPMKPAFRSLNVAVAAAMVTGEALRQLAGSEITLNGASA